MRVFIVLFLFVLFVLLGCRFVTTIVYSEKAKDKDSLTIQEGIISQKAQKIKFIKRGKNVAFVDLSEPVMVAMAEQKEKWGHFQFPNIGKSHDGTLIVSWSMQDDSPMAYGTTGRKYTPMMSKDKGMTWQPQDKVYFAPVYIYNGVLNNNQVIQINTPKSKDINSYKSFPKPVSKSGKHSYYRVEQLPDDLQGIYLSIIGENQKPQSFHAKLVDPGLLRYSISNFMPVVWWGTIRTLADHSLIAGIYPAVYQDSLGNPSPSAVSFYRSTDNGHSWSIYGKIPFQFDGIADKLGDKRYDEPTYEILRDSTFICVMRTGMTSPMYKSFSYNQGKTWTRPVPFTPNGVMPRLLLLKNGVLALASGRPGIQIRFSFDGTGRSWSTPIEMIPYMNADGSFTRDVSCGYPSIIEAGDNSFYLVYSDFTTKNDRGEVRKSIWFRKITVIKN